MSYRGCSRFCTTYRGSVRQSRGLLAACQVYDLTRSAESTSSNKDTFLIEEVKFKLSSTYLLLFELHR